MQRPNGRWRGQIRFPGERRSVTGATREEVLARLDDLRQRYRAKLLGNRTAERELVGAYLARWLEGRLGTVEPKTWRHHERTIALHLTPELGRLRLHQLTAAHLRSLYGRLLAPRGTLGPRSVRGVHTTIRQALDQAVVDGIVPRNVARLIPGSQLPKLPAGRQQRALHPDELGRFLRAAAGDRLAALWLLLARTGLRSGEARALLWTDLDWEPGVLTVQRNLPCGATQAKAPKTAAGIRPVELSGLVLSALREHRKRQAEERLRAGPLYDDQGLIFCTRFGTPVRAENLLRRFRQLLAHAGLRTTLRLHDLRHTAISHQLAAGLSVPEVAASAGHASPAVTTQLYAHAVRRSARRAAEQLEAFYRRPESRAAAE